MRREFAVGWAGGGASAIFVNRGWQAWESALGWALGVAIAFALFRGAKWISDHYQVTRRAPRQEDGK